MKYLLFSLLLILFAAGCDDDDPVRPVIEPSLSIIIDYDVTMGEQPVDVFQLSDGNLGVTLPFINQVRVVTATDGSVIETYEVPSPSGITEDDAGNLIVTTIPGVFDPSFDPTSNDTLFHGVVEIDRGTRTVTPKANFPPFVLNPDGTPNPAGVLARDAVVAPGGRIYVSDLAGGRIFLIDTDGSVSLWTDSELLLGSIDRPGPAGRPPFLTGINGMRWHDGSLYACNTDFGRLVRFPIQTDGRPGPPEVIIEDEALLGFDEFEFAEDGDIYAILAFRYELIRITPAGEVSVLFGPEDGIDNPTGLTRGTGTNASDAFITNLGFITNNAGGNAQPGLLRVSDLFVE